MNQLRFGPLPQGYEAYSLPIPLYRVPPREWGHACPHPLLYGSSSHNFEQPYLQPLPYRGPAPRLEQQPHLQTITYGGQPYGFQQPYLQTSLYQGPAQRFEQPHAQTLSYGCSVQGFQQPHLQTLPHGGPLQWCQEPQQQATSYWGPEQEVSFQNLLNEDLSGFEADLWLPEVATADPQWTDTAPGVPLPTEVIIIEDDDQADAAAFSASPETEELSESVSTPVLEASYSPPKQGLQQQQQQQQHQKRKSLLELDWYTPKEPAIVTAALHPGLNKTVAGRSYLEKTDREHTVRAYRMAAMNSAKKRKTPPKDESHTATSKAGQESARKAKRSKRTTPAAVEVAASLATPGTVGNCEVADELDWDALAAQCEAGMETTEEMEKGAPEEEMCEAELDELTAQCEAGLESTEGVEMSETELNELAALCEAELETTEEVELNEAELDELAALCEAGMEVVNKDEEQFSGHTSDVHKDDGSLHEEDNLDDLFED